MLCVYVRACDICGYNYIYQDRHETTLGVVISPNRFDDVHVFIGVTTYVTIVYQ